MKRIVILGGYGNFGKKVVEGLIAEELIDDPQITLLIVGRNLDRAKNQVNQLKRTANALIEAAVVDITAKDFENRLADLEPTIVIHSAGPFQGQNYRVANACINIGAHYIDLADDRRFVCDVSSLDTLAKNNKLSVISGASSVPGLSSSVVDYYRDKFSTINLIDIAIAPGNKAERGEATVKAILSYTGHPFKVFSKGQWRKALGWMEPTRRDFSGAVGKRWLANVNVPDLELFPKRYAVTDSVKFQAGLEVPFLHFAMWVMAFISKIGLVKDWSKSSKSIVFLSRFFEGFGSDRGAMQVIIEGKDQHNFSKKIIWTLYAADGVGPYIPSVSAIILTKKLIAGELKSVGALPCLGLFELDEFLVHAKKLNISIDEKIIG